MPKKPDAVAMAAGVEEELDQPVTWRALLAFCYKRGILPTPPLPEPEPEPVPAPVPALAPEPAPAKTEDAK